MTRLACQTCGAESYSWSAHDPDPIPLAFTRRHQGLGHTVVSKPIRQRKGAA